MEIARAFGNKRIGSISFDSSNPVDGATSPCKQWRDCYKILYIEKGSCITVDFQHYHIEQDALFFFSIGQHFQIGHHSSGSLIYFNPDFYCIAFHDKELACDGILFNNVFESPFIYLEKEDALVFRGLIERIKNELIKEDFWTEEMTRTFLKQLIITASRSWVRANPEQEDQVESETEISRKFSQLVEQYFTSLHNVADYANLLHISPKTLNRKIVQDKKISPNTIIKDRIMLQAKRLLVHTELSIKEIATQLGYDDASYFVRFFKIQTDRSPVTFRKEHTGKITLG